MSLFLSHSVHLLPLGDSRWWYQNCASKILKCGLCDDRGWWWWWGAGQGGGGASLLYLYLQIQWNPINIVTYGPKKLGRINRVAMLKRVFLHENAWRFLWGAQKKVAVITRWPYYQGGGKVGFHCRYSWSQKVWSLPPLVWNWVQILDLWIWISMDY